MLNLDTHILLHAVNESLRPTEARLLEQDAWSISGIVLWEIAWLHREQRIAISLDDSRLNRVLGGMTVWPIDREVARALRILDFRSDPADEIIAATSVVHGIPLLTRDMRILRSNVVPFAAS